jgi:transposase
MALSPWQPKLSVTMRQTHLAGEKLFVDYAGDGVPVVVDRRTGEIKKAQVCVAVLGASSFLYAQATSHGDVGVKGVKIRSA